MVWVDGLDGEDLVGLEPHATIVDELEDHRDVIALDRQVDQHEPAEKVVNERLELVRGAQAGVEVRAGGVTATVETGAIDAL